MDGQRPRIDQQLVAHWQTFLRVGATNAPVPRWGAPFHPLSHPVCEYIVSRPVDLHHERGTQVELRNPALAGL
jgi:hypothetical protein